MVNQDEDSSRSEDGAYNNTRRQFVAGSAGTLGGLAVGGAIASPALAQEGDEEENGDDTDENGDEEEMPESEFEDDVDILNYALTLEYLEAAFYRQGLENIDEEDFCNCKALSEESNLRDKVVDELQTILEHEEAHAETLASTIEDLGGEPIEEPEFDFGVRVQYPMAFLATAVQLEDVGVSAYAGAAPSIENPDLLAPALGIHSVEARHASFVRTLSDQTGFPNTIDEPRTRAEVLEIASAFIVDDENDEESENGEDESSSDDSSSEDSDSDSDSDSDE